MSTSVTILDGMVVGACSNGPSGRVSQGQPADQPERLFADVQAAAQTRGDSKCDNIKKTDAFGSSSTANEDSAATADQAAAGSVRRKEADAGGDEDASALDSAPEVVLSEIAGEVAENTPVTPLGAEVDEAKPLDSSGLAESATAVTQAPTLTGIKAVEPALVPGRDAAVESQVVDSQGFSDKAGPGAVGGNVVAAEGGADSVLSDSIAGEVPRAGGEASVLPGGSPESDVAGDGGSVNVEGPADGIKALDEPLGGRQGAEGVAHAPTLKEASAAEEKPGETSRQPGPEAVEPGSGALRDVEESADDRRGESRGRDGADDAALLAQRTDAAASQTSEEQARVSNFSASANEVVAPGGVMEPNSPAGPQPIAAQTLAPGNAQEAGLADATPSIREQMLDSMQVSLARGDRQLVVRLRPPELGNIVVRFQGDGDRIDATLEVSKAETRYEVEQALPEVVNGLRDSGVHVTRLEVVVGEEPERDLAKEQTQQEAWSERQNSDSDTDRMGRPGGSDRSVDDAGHHRHLEYAGTGLPPVGQATDRIDLLM